MNEFEDRIGLNFPLEELSKEICKIYNLGQSKKMTKTQKIPTDWKTLIDWYDMFMKSPIGKNWIAWFDKNFPNYTSISDVKKIDFIIFATRQPAEYKNFNLQRTRFYLGK